MYRLMADVVYRWWLTCNRSVMMAYAVSGLAKA